MILIADSGSTKTDWAVIENGSVLKVFNTKGLNPYFVSGKKIVSIIGNRTGSFTANRLDAVYFYGAGCGSQTQRSRVENALRTVFPEAMISVEGDILGAARALFMNRPGIACIIGTGSNSCVYDGKGISEKVFSAGYLFGDEGSGSHMGKIILGDYLKKRLPREIDKAFTTSFGYDREDIIRKIYHGSEPNRFLASFAPFIRENLSNRYIRDLVTECFDSFFSEQVKTLRSHASLPLSCTGSVAWHFRELFGLSARKAGIVPEKYMLTPMEGLIAYHSGGCLEKEKTA